MKSFIALIVLLTIKVVFTNLRKMKVATLVSRGWELLTDHRNDATLKVCHYISWLQLFTMLSATLMKCSENFVVCVGRLVLEQ